MLLLQAFASLSFNFHEDMNGYLRDSRGESPQGLWPMVELLTVESALLTGDGLHYDGGMKDDPLFDEPAIEVKSGKRKTWRYVVIALIVGIFLFGSQLIAIYIDALWFSSLGYGDVYWYKFRLGGILFAIFLAATFVIMRLPFVFLNRVLPQLTERPRVKLAA